MKCNVCGYPTEEGSAFCPNCGVFFKKKEKMKTSKLVPILIILFVLILFGVLAYFIF